MNVVELPSVMVLWSAETIPESGYLSAVNETTPPPGPVSNVTWNVFSSASMVIVSSSATS